MFGSLVIFGIIVAAATFFYALETALRQEVDKRNSFKYVITTEHHVYYANEYSISNGVMTIIDGYNGNPVTFFQQPVAVRQQH